MHYIDIFRPVFSLAAHVSPTASGSGDASQSSVALLEPVLAEARRRRRGARREHFDQAWFALCAWLDETFAEAGPLVARHLLPSGNGEEFFARLDRLLDSSALDRLDPERRDLVEVFSLCLELGFHGPFHRSGDRKILAAYRRRCREVLAESPAASMAMASALAAPERKASYRPVLKTALWIAPVAATIALYSLYRFVLSGLYAQALG